MGLLKVPIYILLSAFVYIPDMFFIWVHLCAVRYYIIFVYMYDYSDMYVYVCMLITYSKGKDQPGKVANLARGQLTRENELLPVSVRD